MFESRPRVPYRLTCSHVQTLAAEPAPDIGHLADLMSGPYDAEAPTPIVPMGALTFLAADGEIGSRLFISRATVAAAHVSIRS